MASKGQKRVMRFPCGVCKEKCLKDCLACALCNKWFHRTCQSISEETFNEWGDIELNYVCVTCRTTDGVEFDYQLGMRRLQKAAETKNFNKLKEAVNRETFFNVSIRLPETPEHPFPEVDPIASEVMDKYIDGYMGDPVKTTGDGNCLFHAASILVYGNESASIKFRYHTCLQLVQNQDRFMELPCRPRIQQVSPSFSQSCFDCATLGNFSNAWTILALTDVVNVNVRILYPKLNGSNDFVYQTLNTEFHPLTPSENSNPINIMWYRMDEVPVPETWYTVNHFAAVIDVHAIPKRSSPNKSDLNSEPLPLPKRKRTSSSSSSSSTVSAISISESYEDYTFLSDDGFKKLDKSEENLFVNTSFIESVEQEHERTPNAATPNALHALPNAKFLDNNTLYSTLVSESEPLDHIPTGPKSNVFVVIGIDPKSNRNCYHDDCGVWDSDTGTTVNQFLHVTERGVLKVVYQKHDLFCYKKMVKGSLEFIPLEPQPTQVLKIRRYYASLKEEKKYKRKISTVVETPDNLAHLKQIAIVEYLGERSSYVNVAHGNSKANEPYRRTDPRCISAATKLVVEGKKGAKEVVADMVADDSMYAPKSSRQVDDMKYRISKKSDNYVSKNNNVADEFQMIQNSMDDHPYIKLFSRESTKHPVIILYTKEQILDLKSNCVGADASIIGIDRTFNLGKVFVTSMSYKNRNVISRKTNQYPVLLGPLCLHFDAETGTYYKFLSHMRFALDSGSVTFGSDEEKALQKALKMSFPESSFVLCTKHLKDNIKHQLQKFGCSETDRVEIVQKIFGEDKEGLVYSQNDTEFSKREADLSQFFKAYPKFHTYYERTLANKLFESVYKPLQEKKLTKLWTNNNAESTNNCMKQAVDWKQLKLQELIERLYKLSTTQTTDLYRALSGVGNFKLYGNSVSQLVDAHTWHAKSRKEKDKLFTKLLMTRSEMCANNEYVHSSDRTYKCKQPMKSAGQKPNQRKRPRPERTAEVKHR